MRSFYGSDSAPIESVIIDDVLSQKSSVALLHSPSVKSHNHHHLYNYWTYNERLRSKNEKLIKRQQASCQIAFYSLWLFILAGVVAIIVYRFTDECSFTTTSDDRRHSIFRCLRYVLFFATIFISILACTGLFYGACRYFRSQPEALVVNDQQQYALTDNYDLPLSKRVHSCCSQIDSSTGTSNLVTHLISNPLDDHSIMTPVSSVPHNSLCRKIPPFTYEEFPTKSISPLQTLSISSCTNGNSSSSTSHPNKNVCFSSSTSVSSSPRSVLAGTIISDTTTPLDVKSKKIIFACDATNQTTSKPCVVCLSPTDVWERQAQPKIVYSPH